MGDQQTVDHCIEEITARFLDGIEDSPTDLDALAQRMGVRRIVDDPSLYVPGELRRIDGQLEIVVLSGLADGRRRFTIAHELGHVVFEQTGRNPPRHGLEVEKYCDQLASAFLMPYGAFLASVGDLPSIASVLAASRVHRVSMTAGFWRLCHLKRMLAFEINKDRVVWSCGLSSRTMAELRTQLRELLDAARRGYSGSTNVEVMLNSGFRRFNIECMNLQADARSVFLARTV